MKMPTLLIFNPWQVFVFRICFRMLYTLCLISRQFNGLSEVFIYIVLNVI